MCWNRDCVMSKNGKKESLQKYQPTLDIRKLATFITTHPGLAIFLVYGLIAIAGFIYLITFYQYFNLDVIVYLELADILTAGIKDPLVMLMVLGSFAVSFFFWLIAYVSAPFSAWLDKKFDKGFLRFIPHLVGVKSIKIFWRITIVVLTLYFFMFISVHSKNKAELIKNQKINLIKVESDAISNNNHQYSLLGTSINYIFLYNHDESNTLIIPLENVRSLKPILRKSN